MRRFLGALLVMSMMLAACGGGTTANGGSGGGGGGGGGGDLPAGSIMIFGASYDPTTLAVTGKASSLKRGTPIVAVGKSFAAHPAANITVEVQSGSTVFPPRPVTASVNPDSADTFAVDLTADNLAAGTWQVQALVGGNTIASGFLIVTP